MSKTTTTKTVIEGICVENPYGNWSDVDKGVYVGGEQIVWNNTSIPYLSTFLNDFIGKNIRITIEEIKEYD